MTRRTSTSAIKDFREMCQSAGLKMRSRSRSTHGRCAAQCAVVVRNPFGEQAVFSAQPQGRVGRTKSSRGSIRCAPRKPWPPIARSSRLIFRRGSTGCRGALCAIVAALGITWIWTGSGHAAGTVAGALKQSPVLRFSNADVGLAGRVSRRRRAGRALFRLAADRLGRKKLFSSQSPSSLMTAATRSRGISELSSVSVSSPARASAANTRRSIRPSRS